MTTNKDYHHGSLRSAMIETGLELISENGISEFTLRGVAKRAGVSIAAPYHHFKNKADLLKAMADQGWFLMGEGFRAYAAAEETPMAKLHAIGRAYIVFALEHTEYFRVMSRPDLYCIDQSCNYEHEGSGLAVFNMLESAVAACFPEKDTDDPFIQRTVLNAWVQVHGLATLWIDGPIKTTHFGEMGIEELMRMLFDIPCAEHEEIE